MPMAVIRRSNPYPSWVLVLDLTGLAKVVTPKTRPNNHFQDFFE